MIWSKAHPQREALLAEAHARPFHATATPSRFIQFAFTTDAARADADRAALGALCRTREASPPAPSAKHHRIPLDAGFLRWEQHAEFTTYTWEAPAEVEPRDLMAGWMGQIPQPGPLLACADVRLIAEPDIDIEGRFRTPALAMAYADDGAAIIATDFHPDHEGFVRFVVADLALTPYRAGALVQRLLELETYRMFALLGLPDTQRLGPMVTAMEQELAALTLAMTRGDEVTDHHDLLRQLTALAARHEAAAAASIFRFGASRAYAEIVQGRLEAIDERSYPGFPSFSAFLSRRLEPAMRTCKTVENRQSILSRKLARTVQLLRARIDIDLQRQNRDLLASVNSRARAQWRLQKAVEALSVAAASYYAVGLLEHVARALPRFGILVDPDLATAVAVPVVTLLIAAFLVLRLRALER